MKNNRLFLALSLFMLIFNGSAKADPYSKRVQAHVDSIILSHFESYKEILNHDNIDLLVDNIVEDLKRDPKFIKDLAQKLKDTGN